MKGKVLGQNITRSLDSIRNFLNANIVASGFSLFCFISRIMTSLMFQLNEPFGSTLDLTFFEFSYSKLFNLQRPVFYFISQNAMTSICMNTSGYVKTLYLAKHRPRHWAHWFSHIMIESSKSVKELPEGYTFKNLKSQIPVI